MPTVPGLIGDARTVVAAIEPVAGSPLTFRLPARTPSGGSSPLAAVAESEIRPEAITLVPFYRASDIRYTAYWTLYTPAEWAASADVYPLEVEDIREAHRVLAGTDPVEGLVTRREDQARELEHQARGLLTHLRGHYAAAAEDGRALTALLTSTIGTVLVFCRGVLRLAGRDLPGDSRAVVAAAAEAADFDAAPFTWALEARREGRTGLAPHDPIGAGYLAAVERLVAFVNAR